jgi:hypothetical protein
MEEQIRQTNPTLHRYLFTVTTFSKLLALSLFIILPFLGFYLGMQYQQKITVAPPVVSEVQKTAIPTPTPLIDISNWKTYTNTTPAFTLAYPSNYSIEDRSKQFPPFTIFMEDKSKEINGGGITQNLNPYFFISVKPSTVGIADYLNNQDNNLTYLSTKLIGENSFTAVRETHGSGYSPQEQYLIKAGNFIINFSNPNGYGIDSNILNQILATFKIAK